MVRIEQVLCLYQDLNPTLLLDHPVGLVKLLEGVSVVDPARQLGIVATQSEAENQNEAMSGEINETVLLPQLYLLKLLSGTDSRRLPWGKEVRISNLKCNQSEFKESSLLLQPE